MGLGHLRQPRRDGRLTLRQRAACVLLAALAFLLLPAQALAQSDTETADARAVMMEAGTITNLFGMDFGQIAQPGVAGTVVLTPLTTPTCAASPGLIRSGTCQAAEFAVAGRKNWVVRVREMNGGTVVLDGPGAATMTVTNYTIRVVDMSPVTGNGGGNPPGTMGRYRILNDSGIGRIRFGGTLNVGAQQAPGVYTGTFVVDVHFN